MMIKQKFIDWLRQSENPDNIILAVLLEQKIIEMPRSAGVEKNMAVANEIGSPCLYKE